MAHPCDECKCPVIPDSKPVEPTIRGEGLVALVVDAPNGYEALGRSVFNGAAGEVLEATIRGVIRASGRTPPDDLLDEVAVLHAVARPTPGGKVPKIAAIRACRERLMEDLVRARPRMVLSLGAAACASLSGTNAATPITKWRGTMRWLDLPDGTTVPWVATISPGSVAAKSSYYRDLSFDTWKAWTQRAPLDPPDVEIVIPRTIDALRGAMALLDDATVISCDIETTSLKPHLGEMISLGYGADAGGGKAYAVIIPREMLELDEVRELCWSETYRTSRRTVFQNGKFDLQFLMKWWGETTIPQEAFLGDTLLLGSLLDERPRKDRIGGLGLKEQASFRYDLPDYHWDWSAFYKSMRDHDQWDLVGGDSVDEPHVDWDGLYGYQALDVANTARYWFDLVDEAMAESPRLLDAHDDVMVPAMRVLAGCELRGAPLDREWLDAYVAHLRRRADRRLSALLTAASSLSAPEDIDLASASQVAGLMYDVWQMTPDVRKRKYKDGQLVEDRSTDKEHIDAAIIKYLSDPALGHAARWLRTLLRWRADMKQLSTYSETLLEKADERGRVHAEFLLHGTVTGRISTANPNLQNIPAVDNKEIVNGRTLYTLRHARTTYWPARRGFAPPPGYLWVEADYSQLELRVAAWLSGDVKLIEVFTTGRDIHREVAATMFSKPPELITKPERYLAKAVDFGLLYGRQGKAIAAGAEMDFYERELGGKRWDAATADAFIAKFLRGYPQLGAWLTSNAADAVANYYVETPFGRRRRFPFKPRTKWERMAIERQANNTPIQGSASDLCLQAMARIEPLLPDGATLLFPVHDSICLEVREDLLDEVERVCRSEMEITLEGGVPLTIDFEYGSSWADTH